MYEDMRDYLIKKNDKTDILSSLEQIDSKIINEILENNRVGMKNINDIANYKLKLVKQTFEDLPFDPSSHFYYSKLLRYENKTTFRPAGADIEDFVVFIYNKNNKPSYYIPDEMKEIIKEFLNVNR